LTAQDLEEKPYSRYIPPPINNNNNNNKDYYDKKQTIMKSATSNNNNYYYNNRNNNLSGDVLYINNKIWICPNIRVRIISDKITYKYIISNNNNNTSSSSDNKNIYLQKGIILSIHRNEDIDVNDNDNNNDDIYKTSSSAIIARIQLDNGIILHNIKQKYLETVLPKDKTEDCLVVYGKYKGYRAYLIEKIKSDSNVKMKLLNVMPTPSYINYNNKQQDGSYSGREVIISMSDVATFISK
jgi:hypothetical protein